MSGAHIDLDQALRPIEGQPGWREDSDGKWFYSSAWLSDVSGPRLKLAPVAAIAGETQEERDALQARRSAQETIAKQAATLPPDGNIGTTGALLRAQSVDQEGRRLSTPDPLVEVDRLRVLVVQALQSAERHGARLVELLGEEVSREDAGIARGRTRTVEMIRNSFEEDTWQR